MSAATAASAIENETSVATDPTHRYDFVFLYDVRDGNPNGDPDAGNAPRLDPETGHGLVSDVCIKRKIRNFIMLTQRTQGADGTVLPRDGFDIYVKEKAILNDQHRLAYKALGIEPKVKGEKAAKKAKGEKATTVEKGPSIEDQARQWMCKNFFDVRMFGAVMSTDVNAGQVRGPVQITFSRSIDPIISLEQSITRMAVTTEEESKKQSGGNRTMGRKEIVPYGLYECHGFVNANLARQTGFNEDDLALLWQSLINLFEHDRSASRGEMSSCKLFVFEHESALGNAPAARLFERIKTTRKDLSKPARAFADYDVAVNDASMPAGVKLISML